MTYESWRISFQSSEYAARSAYAELQRLRAETESLRKDADWISVKDRLPEVSHNEVAVWNGKFTRIGFYLASLKYGYGFFSPMDDRLHGITHWRPMPPGPT